MKCLVDYQFFPVSKEWKAKEPARPFGPGDFKKKEERVAVMTNTEMPRTTSITVTITCSPVIAV